MTALQAEWTKLRTVRSTPWSLVIVAALTIGLGAFICSMNRTEGGGDTDVVALSLSGAYFGQLAAAALGVFAIAAEHSTGTIRATLAANPRRGQVLAAKTALVGALVLGASLVSTLGAFVVGQPILHGNGFDAASLADGAALRSVVNVAVYMALIALLSLGVGAIVRHSAGAMAIVFAALFGPFIVAAMLPEHAWRAMMANAPTAGIAGQENGAPSSPWMGLAVTGAWALVTLGVAWWLMRRRDA